MNRLQVTSKFIIAIILGNMLEFFDFMLYGSFASIFSQLFLPKNSGMNPIIMIFAVFALGFLMRPLGGILYGRIGDRFGCKTSLMISVSMMAVACILLGSLPTFGAVGITASILFLLVRLLQGLSVGGELPGSMIVLTKDAPITRHDFYSAFTMTGISAGFILGALVATVLLHFLGKYNLHVYGWRIAYWLGGVVGIIALIARYREMKGENRIQKNGTQIPFLEALKRFRLGILKAMAIQLIPAVGFQFILVFPITLLNHYMHWPLQEIMVINFFLLIIFSIAVILFARLGDKYGQKLILLIASILFIVLTYPLIKLMALKTLSMVVIAEIVFTLILALYCSCVTAATVDIFKNEPEYTPVALAHSLVFSTIAGTSLLIFSVLIHVTQDLASPAYYVILVALVSCYGVFRLKSE